MSSRAPMNWVTITKVISVISLSVIVASIIALVVLLGQLVSIVVALPKEFAVSTTASRETLPASTVTDSVTPSPALIQARAVLARVHDDIVPREGQATQYGVTFSDAGYQTLIQWNADFKVEERYANAFESLDLRLPCCEWSTPSRNEQNNCACGHHQSLEGLSKKLLSDGWSRDAAQRQVTLWNHYLFPLEAVRGEIEKRGPLSPEMNTALEELKARGEC